MQMLFRADAFNVFNTPNLANPNSLFSCTTTSIQTYLQPGFGLGCTNPTVGGTLNKYFGQVQPTFGNNANTSTNGRKMQFSATVTF
jgi:hypothetical protein